MNRLLLAATGVIVLGIGAAEYLTQNLVFRRWIARVVRHEELQVLVGRHGIYDRAVERAWQAELFARGAAPQDLEDFTASEQKRAALGRLITLEKLNGAAANERGT